VPKPDIAPTSIPGDLALAQFGLTGTIRGAQDVIPALQAGILQQNVASLQRMPPNYAPPLTRARTNSLTHWASSTALPTVSGTTAADGFVLYSAYCRDCHGGHGTGGPNIAINGTDPVAIRAAIDIGISGVSAMISWPGLASLSSNDKDAIANY